MKRRRKEKIMIDALTDFYRCCVILNVSTDDMLGPCRKPEYARPRQVIAYWLRKQGYTLEMIAEVMNRNHTTIIYSIHSVKTTLGGWYDDEVQLLEGKFKQVA